MTKKEIMQSDKEMFKICAEDRRINGRRNIWRIAKNLGCSQETVRRKCKRYLLHQKYADFFKVFKYDLAMRLINHFVKVNGKAEDYDRSTPIDVFAMNDKQLSEISMIGRTRIKKIRQAQERAGL